MTFIISILADIIIKIMETLGYGGLLILMALESCGVPFPSEIIMPFAGFLVSLGKMNFIMATIIGALGNLFGSLLAYYIGKAGGRPLIEKYGKYILISRHDLDMADNWFKKHGQMAVFFGRLLPVVRTYISFPAGIAKMEIKRFSAYTFAGALPWCALFTYLGIKLGENWQTVKDRLHGFDIAIAVIIIAMIIAYIIRHLRNLKK
ncbi:MAG: DedA family protein [bacterium]